MKTCSHCVMDETDPDISFDAQGICDHCSNFFNSVFPRWHRDLTEGKLDAVIQSVKLRGKGSAYDCIIGLSGGLDSSYLAMRAVKDLGLRCLLFHVDAGWNSNLAVSNIEKLIEYLNVDLHTKVIDWDECRNLQLAMFRSGVSHLDAVQDHAFFASMYHFALKYNIKTVLTGANISTECIRNPVSWMYYQSDARQLKSIYRRFGDGEALKNFPFTSVIWHKIYLPYVKNIKLVSPLNFMDFRKKEAADELSKNFGWQGYNQKHGESRFTEFYEKYWLPKRFGIDVRKVQLSSLILTGQITRETAQSVLSVPSWSEYDFSNEADYVADKLEISRFELEQFMTLPLRKYNDFANLKWVYDLGKFAYKLVGFDTGIKR